MDAVHIEIPEDIARSLKMPPQGMKKHLTLELAVQLYQRQLLSLGKARELAGYSKWAFVEVLGERGIARHYDDAALDEDLDFGNTD